MKNKKTDPRLREDRQEKYISMRQAAKLTPYTRDYVSLMARRKVIKAKKFSGKWYTTVESLNEYLKKKRPSDVIEKKEEQKLFYKEGFWGKNTKWQIINVIFMLTVMAIVVYYVISKIENLEEKANDNNFITEEIMKVPDAEGNFDVYEVGRIKVGKEQGVQSEIEAP